MQDLNDMLYFAEVVERGGFAAAGRALGIPKSRLSRRVSELETQLGVRLLQRTTRKLSLTEVGEAYLRHCQAMRESAQAAADTVAQVQTEPRGTIRVSCPVTLAQTVVAEMMPPFLASHPQVRIEMLVSNRAVNLVEEGIDVALRVRSTLDDSGSMVIKRLDHTTQILVASPGLLARQGAPRTLEDLGRMDSIAMSAPDGRSTWTLIGPGGAHQTRRCSTSRAMWPTICSRSNMRRWPAPVCAGCPTTCARTKCARASWCACCPTGHLRPPSCMRCFRRAGGCRPPCGAFWTTWAKPLPAAAA